LVSAAKSNSAPEELIRKLVDLTIKDYSSSEEVAVAVDSRRGSDR
jgi:RNase adaptor protein for sRNA GlmZ degradation